MNDLFAAVSMLCVEGLARNAPGRDGWRLIQEGLDRLEGPSDDAAQSYPVVETYLTAASALASDPVAHRLAAAVLANRDALIWHSSRNTYGNEPELNRFYDNFAFSVVAGPPIRGYPIPWHSEDIMFGLTMQGPHVFYPAHAHEAVELYYVVGGSVEWQQGDGAWQDLSSGAFVCHGAMESHAMRTHDEPLLTFFAWISDLGSRPRWVDPAFATTSSE